MPCRLPLGVNKCLEGRIVGSAAHVNLVVTQKNLSVDDSSALRANAASQFIEDVIASFFFCVECVSFAVYGGVLFSLLITPFRSSSERVRRLLERFF